jgi:nucleoside 2-deoxyribosyltransferase
MTTFYTAGKTWHAPAFQTLRDTLGFDVKARWIDLKQDSDIVINRKGDLWNQCFEDVRDSDFVLVYCEDSAEEQRGALVEIGMAYGMNKPVFCINSCQSLSANGISDVAFTHFKNWTWLESDNLVEGAVEAITAFDSQNTRAYNNMLDDMMPNY